MEGLAQNLLTEDGIQSKVDGGGEFMLRFVSSVCPFRHPHAPASLTQAAKRQHFHFAQFLNHPHIFQKYS